MVEGFARAIVRRIHERWIANRNEQSASRVTYDALDKRFLATSLVVSFYGGKKSCAASLKLLSKLMNER